MLGKSVFGGLPLEIALSTPTPTLLVKHFEGTPRFWVRRVWQFVTTPLPSLNISEQAEVYAQMRRSARPSVDFFVLILLSATIATVGLLQNSTAVIIGAMLVAPLMSPILAMALGIVQGNIRLWRLAGEATIKGIVLAIIVGIVITLISPTRAATGEILGRTEPNLLDLVVALASGAAAGYALSRKDLAAALPGVAIAAALVPPLCVVGYGAGTSQLSIAGGALLLFTTNLIAIIFAAALTFIALGFRSVRTERQERVKRGLRLSLVALAAIFAILAYTTIISINQLARERRVEDLLKKEFLAKSVQVEDYSIESQGDGFIITATVFAFEEPTSEQITAIRQSLSQVVGGPITIQATILSATRQTIADPELPLPTATPIP
jgi:uncharacterized hydrophobic protein (TIGR00271 family)